MAWWTARNVHDVLLSCRHEWSAGTRFAVMGIEDDERQQSVQWDGRERLGGMNSTEKGGVGRYCPACDESAATRCNATAGRSRPTASTISSSSQHQQAPSQSHAQAMGLGELGVQKTGPVLGEQLAPSPTRAH